jgi:hypothetical protein
MLSCATQASLWQTQHDPSSCSKTANGQHGHLAVPGSEHVEDARGVRGIRGPQVFAATERICFTLKGGRTEACIG